MNGETRAMPWQDGQWEMLMARLRQESFPHALLLSGPAGLGKRTFAARLSQSVLCQSRADNGAACGSCKSCKLYRAGSHPDFMVVAPDDDATVIKIDQIRAVGHFATLRSQYGGHKIVLIEPAERMNEAASNSLLKTLEEPSAETALLLVTEQPGKLSATVRSRCQQVKFAAPPAELGRRWLTEGALAPGEAETLLALAHGAPLLAAELAARDGLQAYREVFDMLRGIAARQLDPVTAASAWQRRDPLEALRWLCRWVADMIRYKALGYREPPATLIDDDQLNPVINRLELNQLYAFLDVLNESIAAAGAVKLNVQLTLEDALIRWSEVCQLRSS